jgi:hypothetical protein
MKNKKEKTPEELAKLIKDNPTIEDDFDNPKEIDDDEHESAIK